MKALELRVPPLAVLAAAAALMWTLDRALPEWRLPFPGHLVLAIAVAAAGACLGIAGTVEFRKARTTVNPITPAAASSLVATGIYRYTRNPMYLGLALALLAWALYLAHPAALLGPPAFVAWLNAFQIGPEERALESLFGARYADYRRAVRRWL